MGKSKGLVYTYGNSIWIRLEIASIEVTQGTLMATPLGDKRGKPPKEYLFGHILYFNQLANKFLISVDEEFKKDLSTWRNEDHLKNK